MPRANVIVTYDLRAVRPDGSHVILFTSCRRSECEERAARCDLERWYPGKHMKLEIVECLTPVGKK